MNPNAFHSYDSTGFIRFNSKNFIEQIYFHSDIVSVFFLYNNLRIYTHRRCMWGNECKMKSRTSDHDIKNNSSKCELSVQFVITFEHGICLHSWLALELQVTFGL